MAVFGSLGDALNKGAAAVSMKSGALLARIF